MCESWSVTFRNERELILGYSMLRRAIITDGGNLYYVELNVCCLSTKVKLRSPRCAGDTSCIQYFTSRLLGMCVCH